VLEGRFITDLLIVATTDREYGNAFADKNE
jgi:hypothetical protein